MCMSVYIYIYVGERQERVVKSGAAAVNLRLLIPREKLTPRERERESKKRG